MEMRTEKYIKNYVFGWQDLCMLRITVILIIHMKVQKIVVALYETYKK